MSCMDKPNVLPHFIRRRWKCMAYKLSCNKLGFIVLLGSKWHEEYCVHQKPVRCLISGFSTWCFIFYYRFRNVFFANKIHPLTSNLFLLEELEMNVLLFMEGTLMWWCGRTSKGGKPSRERCPKSRAGKEFSCHWPLTEIKNVRKVGWWQESFGMHG